VVAVDMAEVIMEEDMTITDTEVMTTMAEVIMEEDIININLQNY
jgi:hypothetical protein